VSVYRLVAEAVLGQVVEVVVAEAARRTVGAVVRGERAPRPAAARRPRVVAAPPSDQIHVRSDTPGRVRLAIPWLRHDRAALLDLLADIRGLPGLRQVSGSTRTGTLLVLCDPTAQDARSIAAAVRGTRASRPVADVARLAV
jgi:hypothetical protein